MYNWLNPDFGDSCCIFNSVFTALSQVSAGLRNSLRKSFFKKFTLLLQVMHSFDAEEQGELSLSVGDYVVVRQVWIM